MKKLTYLILPVLTAFFGACSEDVGDYTVRGEALSSFDAQTPANSYAVTINKGTPEATLDFQWTASEAGLQSAVAYKVEFDQAEGDFSAPIYTAVANNEGKATMISLPYSQLLEIAGKITPQEGVYNLSWRVEASNPSGVKKYTLPFTLKLTVPEIGISALTLTAPDDNSLISLNKITKPQEKVVFKWNKSTASDGSALTYRLVADKAGNNFEHPIISTTPATADSVSFTTEELVDLFNTAGYTEINMILEWKVVALVGTAEFASTTRQAAISVQDIPFLYIVGNATLADWSPENGIEMAKVRDGVYEVTTKLFAGDDKGWKFLAGKSWDAQAWGNSTEIPDPMQGTLDATPGAPNIPAPAQDGSYKITVDFTTMTYQVAPGAPERMYIIGDVLGSKSWDNSNQDYIMFRNDNDASNKVYTYTGYFKVGGFKIISEKDLGTWNNLYGEGGNNTLSQAGGAGNINVVRAGYYTLTVDIAHSTYSLEAYTAEATSPYTQISLIGNGGDWINDIDLIQTDYDPHIWTTTATLQAGEIKFRADHEWTTGWGTGETEYGIGDTAQGGSNIAVKATGNYFVKFNDLTGQYIFVQPITQ